MKRIPLRAPALFVLAALALSSCNTVEFYEKGAFQDPVMDLAVPATEAHFLQKVFYSMEGSAGGIGTSAGGGCGCY
jgi:hypothetical protein